MNENHSRGQRSLIPLRAIAFSSRSGVIGIAFFLLVFQAQAVFLSVGPYSLSVYATIGAAALSLVGVAASVMSTFLVGRQAREKPGSRALGPRFAALWPLLALLLYATAWLVWEWRLEGAQNLLALIILTAGILSFSFESSGVRSDKVLVAFIYVGLAVSAAFIVFAFLGLGGFANRQFAMIMLIPLSIAVVWPAKNWLIRISPFVFSFAILFSQSRTASFIAVILLSLHVWLSTKKPPKLIWGSVAAIATAAIVGTVAFFGPALAENFGWVETGVEDRELLGTSGRLTAWVKFLALLDSPAKWAFGIGTGGAMQYGAAEVMWFAHPHNEYLRYLVDVGIIGLLLLLLGAALLLVTFGKEWKTQEPKTRASFLLIVALGLMASTDGPLYSSFVIIPSAIVIGLGLAQVVRSPHPSSRAANRSGL